MNGLLVDSNLLVVFVVGLLDERLIAKHQRTRTYRREDWDLLNQFFGKFNPLVTTPSVLAEVSNLLRDGTTGNRLDQLFATFSQLVTKVLDERYTEAKDIVADSAVSRLGLTDIGIEKIAQTKSPSVHVLTEDLNLFLLLSGRGVQVYNLNHLRGASMGV